MTRHMFRNQVGFTLMEALVAMTLVGVALTLIISGLGRSGLFLTKADLHAVARDLAMQKLDEFILSESNQIADEADQLTIQGVSFGYKLQFQPVKSSDALPTSDTPLNEKLLSVQVSVYWGDQGRTQSLSLETRVLRP